MHFKRYVFFFFVSFMSFFLYTQPVYGWDGSLLKIGMSGDEVFKLQQDLKELGYFQPDPTGYFGSITKSAVCQLQSDHGLSVDGIVGKDTYGRIDLLLGRDNNASIAADAESAVLLTVSAVDDAIQWDGTLLRIGMSGDQVRTLQQNLKDLGYFNTEPTGYFGTITRDAVYQLQSDYGLLADGIVGKSTYGQIARLLGRSIDISRASTSVGNIQKLKWFGEVEYIFSIGSTAKVIDVLTQKSFYVKRTYGYNHADCETLTAEDTAVLIDVAGGYFNWIRRPIIVEVNGYRIAASMAPMPHAGRDDMPANVMVPDRSEGYGYGENLDTIKGNNMNGHFDIHFYMSKTHETNRVNPDHQAAIEKAYNSGL